MGPDSVRADSSAAGQGPSPAGAVPGAPPAPTRPSPTPATAPSPLRSCPMAAAAEQMLPLPDRAHGPFDGSFGGNVLPA